MQKEWTIRYDYCRGLFQKRKAFNTIFERRCIIQKPSSNNNPHATSVHLITRLYKRYIPAVKPACATSTTTFTNVTTSFSAHPQTTFSHHLRLSSTARATMSDPFENPNIPVPALQLRQQSIQQAIDFLNDPRVRHEDPSKALTFLRQRGITEEELREAFRRIDRPFPHPAPLLPYHPHIAPQRPARSSWTSIFLAITAAAGVYAAFREVMRRYVVPLYFPDVAQVEERRLEERRQADRVIESHEREIRKSSNSLISPS